MEPLIQNSHGPEHPGGPSLNQELEGSGILEGGLPSMGSHHKEHQPGGSAGFADTP